MVLAVTRYAIQNFFESNADWLMTVASRVCSGAIKWGLSSSGMPLWEAESPSVLQNVRGRLHAEGKPGARVIEEVMAGASGSPVNYLEGTANLKQVPTAWSWQSFCRGLHNYAEEEKGT